MQYNTSNVTGAHHPAEGAGDRTPSFRAVLHLRVRATRTEWLRLHRARLAEGRANRFHDQLDEHKQHNRHRDLLSSLTNHRTIVPICSKFVYFSLDFAYFANP